MSSNCHSKSQGSEAIIEVIAHKFCIRNRIDLLKSKNAGCFHCESFLDPHSIVEWIDKEEGGTSAHGQTALCPKCGIDSVICDQKEFTVTKHLLNKMSSYWFGNRYEQ